MVKVIDEDGNTFAQGESIDAILDELNAGAEDGNEWFYVYRPQYGVINGYLDANEEDATADEDGEKADIFYDVVMED